MKELKRLLKPLKNKIIINNLILRLFQTVLIGFAAVLLIAVFSKFLYIPFKIYICVGIIILAVLIGVILSFTKYKITDYKIAEEGDKLGCNERLITAYGILNNGCEPTQMEQLAVGDAVNTAKNMDFNKNYKIKFPKKLAIVTAILLAASCLTGFAPDAGVYEFTHTTKQALEEVKKIEKSINDDKAISEDFKSEYNKILKDLNKNLKCAKDAKDAKKQIDDAQKELKKLENKSLADKENIKNSLTDFKAGSDIASAMDANNEESLAKAMEQLAAEIESMSEEELAELAKQLEQLEENLTDEELKELMEEAEKAAQAADAGKSAGSISKAAKSSLSKSLSASSAVSRTASSLAKASDGTGKNATSTPNKNGNKSTGQNGKDDGNSNSGDNPGNGSNGGEGSQNGQSGSGTSNGGSGSEPGGKGRGFGHAETEKIYTMNAENIAGKQEQLNSQQTDEGETTYSETKSDGVNGQSVPYDTVVRDYKEQALKETENGNIPYGMKEVIAEYFSGLEK